MQLTRGASHDAIEGANLVKEVSGMDTYIGLEINNPIYRLNERTQYIFLSLGQPAGGAAPMILSGTQMTIGEMTNSHPHEYTRGPEPIKSQIARQDAFD